MLKIVRINAQGEKVEALIKPEEIDFATERPQSPTNLYDENGNIVSTTPNEPLYKFHFTNGEWLLVDKATYDKLVAYLKPQIL